MVVLLAIVDIRSGDNQPERHSILVYNAMSLRAQLSAICRVFPYFFPLSRVPRPSDCPRSATATRFPSVRHILADSEPTSCERPFASPTAGNIDESCCPRSTHEGASSTGSRCARHTICRSRSFAARQEVALAAFFASSAWECSPLPPPKTHRSHPATRVYGEAAVCSPFCAI